MNEKKQTKRYIVYLSLGIIALIAIISTSYALWVKYYSQSEYNEFQTGCFGISLSDNQASAISLMSTFPMADEDGKLLTPYTFKVVNSNAGACDLNVNYRIVLDIKNTSTINLNYVKVELTGASDLEPAVIGSVRGSLAPNLDINDLENYGESYTILSDAFITSGDEHAYNIRIWIDEEADEYMTDVVGQSLNAKIRLIATPTKIQLLKNVILANYGGEGAIAELPVGSFAKTVQNTGSETATNTKLENGLYKTVDDYGDSYYFRGDSGLVNNWVSKQLGFLCWLLLAYH